MQTTGELIIFVGKFSARVKRAENHFNTGFALLRMDIHRHAAAIISDGNGLIFVEDNFNGFGVAGECFVHTVVDDFLSKVIRARGFGVHARAFFYRVEPREYFNIFCGVVSHNVLKARFDYWIILVGRISRAAA